MKKSILITLLSTLAFSACTQKQPEVLALNNSLLSEQNTVAKVADKDIYEIEFSSYVKSRTQQELESLNSEAQKQLFEEFMQLETLSRKAVIEKLHETEDFKVEVHNLKKNLLAQALLKKFEQESTISDVDLEAQYIIAKSSFEIPQLKARHILVKTQEEAEAIITELNNKKTDFSELAISKSTGPSGTNGGDLGWFAPAQMVPAFSNATIELDVGTFSQEPVKTQFGYHIILKEDERIGEAPPMENLRPRLEQQIKKNRLEKYIKELRGELNVLETFTAKDIPQPVSEQEPQTEELK